MNTKTAITNYGNLLAALILLFVYSCSNAQVSGLNNVGTIYLNGFGNVVKDQVQIGYYFLYDENSQAISNKYTFTVLDMEFKQLSKSVIDINCIAHLMEVVYSGHGYALKFFDNSKSTDLIVFTDEQGKKIGEVRRKLGIVESTSHYLDATQTQDKTAFATIHALQGVGFVEYFGKRKGSKMVYEMCLFDDLGNKKWIYNSSEESKFSEMPDFLDFGKSEVYSLIYKSKSAFERTNADRYLQCNDIATGAKLFEIPVSSTTNQLIPTAGVYDDKSAEFILFGTYYPLNEQVLDKKSQGIFILKTNRKGEELHKQIYSWAEVSKLTPDAEKTRIQAVNALYAHAAFQSTDGKIYVVAEGYNTGAPKGTDAKHILFDGIAGGSTVIEDMMIFSFAADCKLAGARVFAKTKSNVGVSSFIVNPGVFNWGKSILASEAFDLTHIALSKDKTSAVIGYLNFNPATEYSKVNFNYISIDNGVITSGKLDFDRKKSGFFKIKSSAKGQIAIFEYFKKERMLDMRIAKLK